MQGHELYNILWIENSKIGQEKQPSVSYFSRCFLAIIIKKSAEVVQKVLMPLAKKKFNPKI